MNLNAEINTIDYDNDFFAKKYEKNDLKYFILLIVIKISVRLSQDFWK